MFLAFVNTMPSCVPLFIVMRPTPRVELLPMIRESDSGLEAACNADI